MKVTCVVCGGTGKVHAPDVAECTRCHGKGKIYKPGGYTPPTYDDAPAGVTGR